MASKARYHGVPGEKTHQCEASKKDGSRCRQHAIQGLNVCRTHGGGAPLAREAGRRRLALMVAPALAVLESTLKSGDRKLKVVVARDVLNRNGYKPKDEIVLHAEFDASRFKEFSDVELETFIRLAKRASTLHAIDDDVPAEDDAPADPTLPN